MGGSISIWRSNPQQALTDDQMGVVCVPTPVYYTLSSITARAAARETPKAK